MDYPPTSSPTSSSTPFWSSRLAFIIVCVGAAVGLGNIWKFPYMAGEQGGGAFVIVYLITIFLVAVPVLVAELMLGKLGKKNAVSTMEKLTAESPPIQKGFVSIGWIGFFGCILVLSFYAVIAGWVMAYAGFAFQGFSKDAGLIGEQFGRFLENPATLIMWQALFLVITCVISAAKLDKGIERANIILVPLLVLMLLVVVFYGAYIGDLKAAFGFLFMPDFSKVSADMMISAVGHAFFSVGVGFCALLVFASYLKQDINLVKAASIIALADTLIALLAGLAIFTIVFGYGLEPSSGPGLIFTTLPIAFSQMPLGDFMGCLFFVLVFFAALTSSVGVIEVPMSHLCERYRLSRAEAATINGLILFVLGLLTVFSFNIWADVKVPLWDKNFFDVKDYLTSKIMLPLTGILTVLFAGWGLAKTQTEAFFQDTKPLYSVWMWLSRVVAPIAVGWVLFANL